MRESEEKFGWLELLALVMGAAAQLSVAVMWWQALL